MAERFITVPGYNTLTYTCPAGKSAIINGLTVAMASAGACSIYINGSPAFAKSLTADTHNMIYHTGKITVSEHQTIAVYGKGKMQLAVLEVDSDFTDSSIVTTNNFIQNRLTDTVVDYNSTHNKDNISIPSVTKIADGAFYNKGLTGTITLPATLISVGSFAFASATTGSLASGILPSGLTTIGVSAFQNNPNLATSLVFPASLTTLGDFAFAGVSSLTSIDLRLATNWTPSTSASYPCEFLNAPLTTIKLPANKTFVNGSLNNSPALLNAYNATGKLAGTYQWDGSNWTRTGA